MSGIVLIAVPILFNAGFTLLAQRFDYPEVLRQPTHDVLERSTRGVGSVHRRRLDSLRESRQS